MLAVKHTVKRMKFIGLDMNPTAFLFRTQQIFVHNAIY